MPYHFLINQAENYDEITIGNLKYQYCKYEDTKSFINCYELPARDHDGGPSDIYSGIDGNVEIKDKGTLVFRNTVVLVDEGADFIIAAVVKQRDGVALPPSHRYVYSQFQPYSIDTSALSTVRHVIEERRRSAVQEVRKLTENTDISDQPCSDFVQPDCKYSHYLDAICT